MCRARGNLSSASRRSRDERQEYDRKRLVTADRLRGAIDPKPKYAPS